MLTYLLTRWRLTRLFEPYENGFLFRRRATAPAVLVTAEEKSEIFRRFRSAYWRSHALLWACSIAAITAAVVLATLMGAPAEAGTVIGYGFAVILLAGCLYVDRRVFNAAASSITDRPAEKPARGWFDIQDEHIRKTRWWRLIAGGAFLAGIAWLTFPIVARGTWAALGWFCYFGFCLVMWGRNVWRKVQLESFR
jgi:hypothetical protein